jgi:hypothetical protein
MAEKKKVMGDEVYFFFGYLLCIDKGTLCPGETGGGGVRTSDSGS